MNTAKKVIILVDDNETNLTIGKNILKDEYSVFTVTSCASLFNVLEKIKPDLILLDDDMPVEDGYTAIKRLKASPIFENIPVIFLSSKMDAGCEAEALKLGAVDFCTKPFSPPILHKRIENVLQTKYLERKIENFNITLRERVTEKTSEIVSLHNAVMKVVSELLEFRDEANSGHISRIQMYLKILLDTCKNENIYSDEISKWDEAAFISSSVLHDVGKIAISDAVLFKESPLTEQEFNTIKWHTTFGEKVIEEMERQTISGPFFDFAKTIALSHHEKWDGTGYPRGISGSAIPLPARLAAIADVYDCLISARPYRDSVTTGTAESIVAESFGTAFDPALKKIFDACAKEFTSIAVNIKA
jgi:putative two-component system response regulator